MNSNESDTPLLDAAHDVKNDLIPPKEVASEFHVPIPTQHGKRNSNSSMYDPTWPQPLRVGRRKLLYRRSELMQWLEASRVQAPVAIGGAK